MFEIDYFSKFSELQIKANPIYPRNDIGIARLFFDLHSEFIRYVIENMRLSEELGLSDKAVAKLKRWSNERLADEARAPLIEIFSDILSNDDFDVFLKRAQQYIIENLDYRLYEEERNKKGSAYTEQDVAWTAGDADNHARIVGMRAIKAEDLSIFYRYQAVETLGVILAFLPDEFYIAYHQKREETEHDKQRAKRTT